MTLRPDEAGRLVYGGQFSAIVGGIDDDGRLHASGFGASLDACRGLAILDPLSFPYERLGEQHRDLPVDVVLADGRLDAEGMIAVLHRPLLSQLTPVDRLVVADDDLWSMIERRYQFDPSQRLLPAAASLEAAVDILAAAWRSESVIVVETAMGTFAGHADDLVTRHLAEHGAHQRSDLAALRSLTRPGDLILDVGAHIGTFAIPLAAAVGPTGRVVAFEADPANAELLVENVASNDLVDSVTVLNVAVGGAGRFVAAGRIEGNTGATSMTPAHAGDIGTIVGLPLDAWWDEQGRPPVAVLKVDTEGMELDVLESGPELLDACRPVLQIEVARDQLHEAGRDVRELSVLLASLDCRLFVNTLERNRPDDRFRLEPIESILEPDERVFDVYAFPGGSDRAPSPGEDLP